jgi:exodeoxyribonuclease VIII
MTSTITNEQYHSDPAVSASHLKAVMQSPYHYWSRYVDPNRSPVEPTAAMKLGSLAHCAILEPDELLNRYGICAPRNTKAGKEQAAAMEAEGIEVVTSSDMALAMGMSAAVQAHPAAAALLQQGKAEQSFWWDDLPTGMRCKCRPDWYYGSTVVDIKTTTDASPQAFARSVATFGYHIQAAHYLAGLHGAERFVFVAVEKTYPHAVAVYELDSEALALGRTMRDNGMDVIAGCHAAGVWPGYGDTVIQTISLPKWATNAIQTETF